VENRRFASTYRWLDRHGEYRKIDIFVDTAPTREVEAFAAGEEGEPVLVARLDAHGKFTRLARAESVQYGLDTAAAWNNLYDLCRSAHGHHSGPY
jgi:hypothetical protein